AEKGKDATVLPTALASYAARAVKSGSRVAGQEMANDVLSPVAQRRHHFFVGRLPDFETLTEHPLCVPSRSMEHIRISVFPTGEDRIPPDASRPPPDACHFQAGLQQ